MPEAGPGLDPCPPLLHGFFGGPLHAHVEGGVDVVSGCVELASEALVQHLAGPLHEIRCDGPAVDRTFGRKRSIRVTLEVFSGDHALIDHTPEHEAPPPFGVFEVPNRTVVFRTVYDTGKQRGLRRVEVHGVLREVVSRRGLDSIPPVGVVDLVDVGFEDLVFCVSTLEGEGHLQLFDLSDDATQPGSDSSVDRCLEHVAGELLRDRAPSACAPALAGEHADDGSREPTRVDASVVVEALVLYGHKRL